MDPAADFERSVQYLYARLPAYQRIGGKAYKKDLTNILKLCALLGHPERRFRSVHIAGTNGKGSVAHMLAAVLTEAGYRTGLYTSPHIHDFRERIRIGGAPVPAAEVVRFVESMKDAIEDIRPSFFEITVAMAFHYFAEQGVDVAVVETGLGGRLDSTNILQPLLSVITNIGMDHTDMLGDRLEVIAAEKAGIIKEATPVVIGRSQPDTLEVFRRTAAEKHAPLYFADQVFGITGSSMENGRRRIQLEQLGTPGDTTELLLDLTAVYQAENARTAVTALSLLETTFPGSSQPEVLRRGFAHAAKLTGLSGRWQVIGQQPRIVLEAAHNPDGMAALKLQLEQETFQKLHVVFGCVKDKSLAGMVSMLPDDARYYITRPAIDRGLDEDAAAAIFREAGKTVVHQCADPRACLEAALGNSRPDDLVLITGSIFLLGSFVNHYITL